MIINLGDAPFKAFITVSYPKGTCTLTDGSTTLSHSGGGSYTFTVKKKGSYTVKIQQGSAVKTAAVSISRRGQTVSLSLDYRLYLYNAGSTDLTISFRTEQSATGTLGSDCITMTGSEKWYGDIQMDTEPAIDLSPYSTANFLIENTGSASGFYIGFGPTKGTTSTARISVSGELAKTTKSLDISELNTAYYFTAERYTNSSSLGNGTAKIYSAWLDV